jgi:AcrR family transcriptional regulator
VASPEQTKRTRDSARSKAEILQAARAEFAEHGIAGARIDRIAAAAGFNKALIYAYFENKDALFDEAFAAHVQHHLNRAKFDGTDLPGYAARLFDIFEQDPAVLRLAQWYRLERSTGPGLTAVVAANETRLENLRQAQRDGKLTDRLDATALLVLVHAIAGAWATLNPEFSAASAPEREARRDAVIAAVSRLVATDAR